VIKAFLFDYGGVMTAGGAANSMAADMATTFGVNVSQTTEFFKSPLWSEYIRGRMSDNDLWDSLGKKWGRTITTAQRDHWNSHGLQPLPAMQQLIRRLRKQSYAVGLLSNITAGPAQYIRSMGGYDDFSFTVLSYEVHCAKPDPEFYAIAAERLGDIPTSQAVLIDDQERCLVPARELGMKAILVDSPEQAITAVNSLLGSEHAH
jgi:HAD superfamily hydrolase (TIGR01509 family)